MLAVWTEYETAFPNPIVFLPFLSIYYDKPLFATLCHISQMLAVWTEYETACPNPIVFLPFLSIYYDKLLSPRSAT